MTDRNRKTAPKDGVYLLGRGRYQIRQGEALPPGAAFVDADDEQAEQEATEQRQRSRRVLNNELAVAVGLGPSETTEATGPAGMFVAEEDLTPQQKAARTRAANQARKEAEESVDSGGTGAAEGAGDAGNPGDVVVSVDPDTTGE